MLLFDSVDQQVVDKIVNICFRKSIVEIPSTKYGTFSIYKYPAKFIPQVIAYSLRKYAKQGMKIFDPFSGCGTVGLVSRIYGFDYEIWDLNPLLKFIHESAILSLSYKVKVNELINELKNSKKEFLPNWSNLTYWFPEEFLPVLSKAWGFVNENDLPFETKRMLLIPLLKTTRYFSYSDEKIHKLYCSQFSRKKVMSLLKRNWETEFYKMLEKEIFALIKKVREYNAICPKTVNYTIKAGVDVLNTQLDNNVNILITSPPYLQAQEYIRSTKLELFWLGYNEDYIKELCRKEIPYNSTIKEIEIQSETYYKYRNMIKEQNLLLLYDRYFHAILSVFSILGKRVENYLFIFVSPVQVKTLPIPIDKIIIEHLRELNWEHDMTYIDKIVSRVMFEFKTGINPSSKLPNHRTKTEHLVVLKRK